MRAALLFSFVIGHVHAWNSCTSRRQALIGSSSWILVGTAACEASSSAPFVTHTVFMDIQINNSQQPQRLEIDLFGKDMPNVVTQFVELCRTNAYAGSSFYRVLSDFSIQGGGMDNSPTIPVDNYNIKHSSRGLISTGVPNAAADSRFFVQLTDDAGWADDRYAAFGKVTASTFPLVQEIEKVPVRPPKNSPRSPVTIVASGVLREY